MKKHHLLLIGYIVFVILYLLIASFYPFGHQCDWEDCELTGKLFFESTWGYEEYTDGWCVERTHFKYPEWTYEQCEAYVFSSID